MATNIYSNQHPLTAPHQATSDGTVNPAYRDGKSKVQYPVGEVAVRTGQAAGASAAPAVVTTFGPFGH